MNIEGPAESFEYLNPENHPCIARLQRNQANAGDKNNPQWEWSGNNRQSWANEDALRVRTFSGIPPDAHVELHESDTEVPGYINYKFEIWFGGNPDKSTFKFFGIIDHAGHKWTVTREQIHPGSPIKFTLKKV